MPRSHARTTVGALVLAAVALLTAACAAEPEPLPSPTTPASTPAPPTPAPSAEAPSVELPNDCDALATEETRAATVGGMNLQSDGEGFVRPSPDGATLALGCDWIEGEASGALLLISSATAESVASAVESLPAEGYACEPSAELGGERCEGPGVGPGHGEVVVARDTVWISLSTVNVDGERFLSEIVAEIFD